MREKLIEILETVAYPEVLCDGEVLVSTARVADHLIANGVTIPVRCKDCKHHEHFDSLLYCDHIRGLAGSVSPNDFCSYGERREGE